MCSPRSLDPRPLRPKLRRSLRRHSTGTRGGAMWAASGGGTPGLRSASGGVGVVGRPMRRNGPRRCARRPLRRSARRREAAASPPAWGEGEHDVDHRSQPGEVNHERDRPRAGESTPRKLRRSRSLMSACGKRVRGVGVESGGGHRVLMVRSPSHDAKELEFMERPEDPSRPTHAFGEATTRLYSRRSTWSTDLRNRRG